MKFCGTSFSVCFLLNSPTAKSNRRCGKACRSLLHAGGDHALDELLLEQQEQNEHRNHGDHRHRQHAVPVHGVLAGYPVVYLKATLYDGSYHPVDSSEMAFKMAAAIAYKNGIPQASPTLLEPIGNLKASVPDANMGDVMGEINKRRGRVLGMNPGENGMQVVEADVPMAEMGDFATFIRQCTQDRGTFTFEFARYEDAPAQAAQKVIEEAKAAQEGAGE